MFTKLKNKKIKENYYNKFIYLSIYLSMYPSMAVQSFAGSWRLFQFLTVGRGPWRGDQPFANLCLCTEQHKENNRTDIHISNGIQTHEPSVPAGKDLSCLRQHGYCDRLTNLW
jgi:hypothetical protein